MIWERSFFTLTWVWGKGRKSILGATMEQKNINKAVDNGETINSASYLAQYKHYVLMCLECDDRDVKHYSQLKKQAKELYEKERDGK